MMKSQEKSEQIPGGADRQWDIDRYLLDDPTLDRDAFEQQMLDDPALAEQVATSVAQWKILEIAAKSVQPSKRLDDMPSIPTGSGLSVGSWAVLATVALMLVALSLWSLFSNPAPRGVVVASKLAASERLLSQIAERWLDVESPQVYVQEEELISESDLGLRRGEQTEMELSDQSDWLFEAARQFYQESSEGV
jgi:hypothetical protein